VAWPDQFRPAAPKDVKLIPYCHRHAVDEPNRPNAAGGCNVAPWQGNRRCSLLGLPGWRRRPGRAQPATRGDCVPCWAGPTGLLPRGEVPVRTLLPASLHEACGRSTAERRSPCTGRSGPGGPREWPALPQACYPRTQPHAATVPDPRPRSSPRDTPRHGQMTRVASAGSTG
jgi:hypothetical protein